MNCFRDVSEIIIRNGHTYSLMTIIHCDYSFKQVLHHSRLVSSVPFAILLMGSW